MAEFVHKSSKYDSRAEKQNEAAGAELAEEDAEKVAKAQARKRELDEKTEELLDEIDGLLEEDAEEFVKAYRQKGGQ